MHMTDLRMFKTVLLFSYPMCGMEGHNNSYIKDKMRMTWVSKVLDFTNHVAK